VPSPGLPDTAERPPISPSPNVAADSAESLGTEVRRILGQVGEEGPYLRLTGSIAVQVRCPEFGHLARQGRQFHDIDFAGYRRHARQITELLTGLGYVEDREVTVVSDGSRAIFEYGPRGLHLDLFYDRLDFCHVIPLAGRLEADRTTLPLAELLLGKLQIVRINEKDLVDSIVLLLEHPLGESDAGSLNLARLARLCAEDWGLWRTATMNLDKVGSLARTDRRLGAPERGRIDAQLAAIRDRLQAEPKPLAWRIRAKVGDRMKWYKEVEDVR
jgi:hypothetical protein